jgi:hypothetical protein
VLAGAGEQEGDKGVCLVGGDLLAVAEDLFELVDQDQECRVSQRLGTFDDLDQSKGTTPQRRLKKSRRFFAVPAGSEDIGGGECTGQPPERSIAGPQLANPPSRTHLSHEPSRECREHPGLDQRRLPTAGRADNSKEAIVGKTSEQLVGLPFATEEDVRFVVAERSQSGIGAAAELDSDCHDSTLSG